MNDFWQSSLNGPRKRGGGRKPATPQAPPPTAANPSPTMAASTVAAPAPAVAAPVAMSKNKLLVGIAIGIVVVLLIKRG